MMPRSFYLHLWVVNACIARFQPGAVPRTDRVQESITLSSCHDSPFGSTVTHFQHDRWLQRNRWLCWSGPVYPQTPQLLLVTQIGNQRGLCLEEPCCLWRGICFHISIAISICQRWMALGCQMETSMWGGWLQASWCWMPGVRGKQHHVLLFTPQHSTVTVSSDLLVRAQNKKEWICL